MDKSFIVTRSATAKTVNVHAATVQPPSNGQVLVKYQYSPINPLDLAVIAGAYPVKPVFEHEGEPILGFDGIGKVLQLGPEVKTLEVGDYVVPARYGLGTWRSHAAMDESLLDKIPKPADQRFGAILRLAVAPAYFLVESMRKLRPGNCLVQNAGTSVISQMVIQFANSRGVSVRSIIRDRENAPQVVEELVATGKASGNTTSKAITESELANTKPDVKYAIAIDSVGGLSAEQLLDCLAPGGTFVQHGFLSGTEQILPMNAASFWARHLEMQSSRTSAQMAGLTEDERHDLFTWFVDLHNAGELQLPRLGLQEVAIDTTDVEKNKNSLQDAVTKAQRAKLGQRKQLIVWDF